MSSHDPLTPTILQLHAEQANYTVNGTAWIPQSARLLTVGMTSRGTGPVSIWEMKNQKLSVQSSCEHAHAIKCVSFGASIVPKREFAIGDHNGGLGVFDIERLKTPIFAAKAHDGMVHCLDAFGGKNPAVYGAPEIVTGGSDGVVNVWDIRRPAPVVRLRPNSESALDVGRKDEGYVRVYPECWAVAFGGASSPTHRYIAMGYDNGDLKVLDLREQRLVYEQHFPNGIVGIDYDRPDIAPNKIVASTLQGHAYIIDQRTFHQTEHYAMLDYKPFGSDSTATLWRVSHAPSSRDVFATCGGGRLALCKYEPPAERTRKLEDGSEVGVMGTCRTVCDIPVSQQTITTLCWNREKHGLLGWSGVDQTVSIGFVTNLSSLE